MEERTETPSLKKGRKEVTTVGTAQVGLKICCRKLRLSPSDGVFFFFFFFQKVNKKKRMQGDSRRAKRKP